MAEWQSIETVPKDGRHMLLFYRNALGKPRTLVGSWWTPLTDEYDDNGLEIPGEMAWYEASWVCEQAYQMEEEPTHWMALPDNPARPCSHEWLMSTDCPLCAAESSPPKEIVP